MVGMKKVLCLTIAALALTLGAYAQENGQRQRGERPDEATMVKMRTERMVKELGLDATQEAKLLELNQKYPHIMMGPGGPGGPGRDGHGGPGMGRPPKDDNNGDKSREDRMKEIQAEREAYDAGLKEILTEDQYKTWQENRDKHPQGRPQGRPHGRQRDRQQGRAIAS